MSSFLELNHIQIIYVPYSRTSKHPYNFVFRTNLLHPRQIPDAFNLTTSFPAQIFFILAKSPTLSILQLRFPHKSSSSWPNPRRFQSYHLILRTNLLHPGQIPDAFNLTTSFSAQIFFILAKSPTLSILQLRVPHKSSSSWPDHRRFQSYNFVFRTNLLHPGQIPDAFNLTTSFSAQIFFILAKSPTLSILFPG